MKGIFFIILVILLLPSCTQFKQFQIQSAEVADAGLSTSEWGVCNAATIGSIRRRYGGNPDAATAWQLFCEESGKLPGLFPPETQ